MGSCISAVDIYWFSGTGNTLLVAREMSSAFAEAGVDVALSRMETTDPAAVRPDRTIGIACPVACQGTYPLVWSFVEGLPPVDGAGAFLVDTLAGRSGGIVGPMRRIVERKGYTPLGAREIIMPSNLFCRKPKDARTRRSAGEVAQDAMMPSDALCKPVEDERDVRKRQEGLAAARRFAADLMAGTADWAPWSVSQGMLRWTSTCAPTRWLLHRMIRLRADEGACTRCGLCARLCPVGNITVDDAPPVFADKCQACMRCFSFCPTGAIRIGKRDLGRYRAVEAADLLGGAET